MGEMKVGDRINGPDGTIVTVIGVYPQGMEDVYRLTLVDGRNVRASLGHLWRITADGAEMTVTTDYIRKLLEERVEVAVPVETLDCWVAVDRVTYDSITHTQCIKVNSADGLFVTNDDIITHNTDGAIGKWLQHAARYGEDAKGVFFRRRFKQLEEVQSRCSALFPRLGANYHKGDAVWAFPNGAILKLRHLWDVTATEEYQGHNYCVARGTPVLMADGAYKPIEAVQVGEKVMTLDGPKSVTGRMAPKVKLCVLAEVFDQHGRKMGEQIHPEDHPVLSSVSPPHGVRSHVGQVPSLPSCSQESGSAGEPLLSVHRGSSSQHSRYLSGPIAPELDTPQCGSYQNAPPQPLSPSPWQSYKTLLDVHRGSQETDACREGGQTYCRASADGHQEAPPRLPLSAPVMLHVPDLQSDAQCQQISTRYRTSGISCELSLGLDQETIAGLVGHQPQHARVQWCQHRSRAHLRDDAHGYDRLASRIDVDCLDGCSTHLHQCDERAPLFLGNARVFSPSPDGVERYILTDGNADVLERTGECTRPDLVSYIHPYTGELRKVHQRYQFGRVVYQPCGLHEVFDLTIQDANHYITESGLINRNSWLCFEELTNWSTPEAIDRMRGTLRSAKGVPVELIMTGNPGGSGHSWVKARYISPAPQGWTPIKDIETGEYRIYIPSRLEDNTAMMRNDPNYARRLRATGSESLVRAWLGGDWDIVAGGYFDDLIRPDRHFLTPFEIPISWTWRRSFDWGSAAPASLGIWAISDGTPVDDLDGYVFPRGSLIRVKEWYTVSRNEKTGDIVPNEGLRLTNLALGNGIAQRSFGYRFSGCVADPAIFSKLGRDSIYQEMQKGAKEAGHNLVFSPADNSRIAGWQKMRDMLENAAQEYPEKPGLWVMENCTHWLRTVPVLQRAENDQDDIDTTQEDHVADDTRYICMTGARSMKVGDLSGR